MKRQLLIIVLFSICIPLFGLSACGGELRKEDISCEQAWELIQKHKADSNFVIIDFRPKEKFDEAHIENAVYYDVFDDSVEVQLERLDKNGTYLIYCTMGYSSGKGLEKMKKLNFKNIYHLYQGIEQWLKEGYKTLAAPVQEKK